MDALFDQKWVLWVGVKGWTFRTDTNICHDPLFSDCTLGWGLRSQPSPSTRMPWNWTDFHLFYRLCETWMGRRVKRQIISVWWAKLRKKLWSPYVGIPHCAHPWTCPVSVWSGYFWRRKILNSTGMQFELRLMPEMLQQKRHQLCLSICERCQMPWNYLYI